MFCVYKETAVCRGHVSHIRQFREDIDGNRFPIFPANRGVIKLADDGSRYQVRNVHGELLFAGEGIAEAVARINYAQGAGVDISVNVGGRQWTLKQYMARIAPVIFRIRYTHGQASDVLGVAMDVIKAGKVLAEWTFAKVGEEAAANEIIKTIDGHPKKGKNFAVVFSHKAIKPVVEQFGTRYDIPRQNFEHLVEKSNQARQAIELKK